MISRIILSLTSVKTLIKEFYMIFMIKQNEFSYDDITIHITCIFREIKAYFYGNSQTLWTGDSSPAGETEC